MQDDRIALRVGAGVLAGVLLAAVLMVALQGVHLRPGVRAAVVLSYAGSLREGSDVQVAGRTIGGITAVRLLGRGEAQPGEPVGGVVVDIWVDSRRAWMAPPNGEWFVSSKGILGERYLEIGPPVDGGQPARALASGDRIRGTDPAHLDRLAARSLDNITQMRLLTRELLPAGHDLAVELEALGDTLDAVVPADGDLARTWAALRGLADESRALADDWRAAELSPARLRALAAHARDVFDRGGAQIDALRARTSLLMASVESARGRLDPARLARFRTAWERTDRVLAQARDVMARGQALADFVAAGGGTIGALLNDPTFADDAKQVGKTMKRQPWALIGHPPRE